MTTAGGWRRLVEFVARPRNLIAMTACVWSAAAVVAAVTPVVDQDVWWVAAAGREMLASRAVPTMNVFSFVDPTHPWLMHEWVYGPIYAIGVQRFGPAFFAMVALASMVAGYVMIAAGTIGRARNASAGLALALGAVTFYGTRFLTARPTGVSLLFPIALTLLAFRPALSWQRVVVATLLELAWANAHGSFPLGIAILGVAALDASRDRARRLVATCTAALATLANPYGLALHRFVWGYFRGSDGIYKEINTHIQEFGSIVRAWGSTVGTVDVVGFVLVTLLAASALWTPRYRIRGLFCLALLAMGARQARQLELAGLLSSLLLVDHADDLSERLTEPHESSPASRRRAMALVVGIAGTFGLGAFGVTYARRAPTEWVGGGASVLNAIAALPDGARAFVPFGSAGAAIWYAFPRGVRVFFDPRNDCYSPETLRAFWTLSRVAPDAERRAALDRSGADAAIVPRGHPLATFLAREPTWTVAYDQAGWLMYRRVT